MKSLARILKGFVLSLPLLLLLAPPSAAKSLGVILTGDIQHFNDIHTAAMDALFEDGFAEREELQIIMQKPTPDTMAWHNAARKLITLEVDAILVYGSSAAMTVTEETTRTPIVFASVYDPESLGLHGGNVTGVSASVPVSTILDSLKKVGKLSNVGVIYNKTEKGTILQAKEVKKLEASMGFAAKYFNTGNADSVDQIKDVDALFLTSCCAAMVCIDRIIGVAREMKIPTAAVIGGGEERGVVFTLSPDPADQGRKAAGIVKKVLTGTPPASIPIQNPEVMNLTINLKEANALGIKIPFDVLTSATKVIK